MEYTTYEDLGDGVVLVTLNRPERLNALSDKNITELRSEAVPRFRDDPNAKVMVLTGAGRAFCAGRDMKESGSGTKKLMSEMPDEEAPPSLREFPVVNKPTIAAVNGMALGGGLQLALTCDIVLASERATFGWVQLPAGMIAPWYNGLIHNLAWPAVADMILTGEPISAERAREIGLVSRVLPHADLLPAAVAMAKRIAGWPAEELGYTVSFMHEARHLPSPELHAAARAAYRATDPEARVARKPA